MDGVFADALGKEGADSAGGSLSRVGSADEGAEVFHRIVFFQDSRHDGAGGHEVHQFSVEGALLMHFVKLAGFFRGELGQFHRYDAEARLVDLGEDAADVARLNGIGLDHGKSLVSSHCEIILAMCFQKEPQK